MTHEDDLRQQMATLCASQFQRGFRMGTAGNVSARLGDALLMVPTNALLGGLDPARIAKRDAEGRHLAGDRLTTEAFLHRTAPVARWCICTRLGPRHILP